MARMIDPSELEGEELERWYRRSAADVEAEKAAARRDQYDAFVRSIGVGSLAAGNGGADNQQPDDQSAQGGSEQNVPGVIRARFAMPTAPPVMTAPAGPEVGPSMDATGMAPSSSAKSGFFGTHNFVSAFGAYQTDLPNPLNYVEATAGGWWILGDNSRVPTDEVERIYAEQQSRLRGQTGPEPEAHLRAVDRVKDGVIPRAQEVSKGERELDPTCSPYGGWERDPGFPRYSQRTQRYEKQVTRAPGLDYVVRIPGQRPVKFDGCAVWDPRHPLLEAKGPGYASLLPRSMDWGFYGNMLQGAVNQADRQASAAAGKRIEWHVAEPDAMKFFEDATYGDQPPIVVKQTPVQ